MMVAASTPSAPLVLPPMRALKRKKARDVKVIPFTQKLVKLFEVRRHCVRSVTD